MCCSESQSLKSLESYKRFGILSVELGSGEVPFSGGQTGRRATEDERTWSYLS